MKIRKNAEQKTFLVDTAKYTGDVLSKMYTIGIIENPFDERDEYGTLRYRIYADTCTDIKVIYENGFYHTVAITEDGRKIFVKL